MLDRLGKIVTAKPWLVVGIVLVITIGFSTLLPTLEMQTSMDDFLPDDKVILADERIQEFFGTTNEVVMVLSEGESKESILSASGLKILYQISEDLVDIDDVDSVMSIAGFIDMVCNLEYNKSVDECLSLIHI